jgi:hypothetical protein
LTWVPSALVTFGTRSPRTQGQSKGGANHTTRTSVFLRASVVPSQAHCSLYLGNGTPAKPNAPDVRDLIEQIESTEKFKSGDRKKPAELRANYRFAESQLGNLPAQVGVVDDLLTTGSHFRAVKDMILERAPDTRVVGFFIARRAIPNPFGEVSIEDLLAP